MYSVRFVHYFRSVQQIDQSFFASTFASLRAIPQSLVCSDLFSFFFIGVFIYVHVHITRRVRRDPSMPDEVQAVISRLTSGCYAIWKGFSESPTSSTSQKSVCVRAGRSCRLFFLSLFSRIRSSRGVAVSRLCRSEKIVLIRLAGVHTDPWNDRVRSNRYRESDPPRARRKKEEGIFVIIVRASFSKSNIVQVPLSSEGLALKKLGTPLRRNRSQEIISEISRYRWGMRIRDS